MGAERGLLGLAPPLPPQHSAEATPVHDGFDQHMTYWLRRTRAAEHPDAQVVVLLWVVRLETIRQSGHGLIVPNPRPRRAHVAAQASLLTRPCHHPAIGMEVRSMASGDTCVARRAVTSRLLAGIDHSAQRRGGATALCRN